MNDKNIYRLVKRLIILIAFLFTIPFSAKSANETFSGGSLIINMGNVPQTVGNAIKPYGAIYDLLRNYNVPIKWVIAPGKAKDGNDFIYNGRQYKGGTLIIPAEYRSAAFKARITFWQGQSVEGIFNTRFLSACKNEIPYTL